MTNTTVRKSDFIQVEEAKKIYEEKQIKKY